MTFSRQRRALEDANKTMLGTVSLIVVAILVANVILIGTMDLGQTKYRAEFAQAAQIRPGDQVTVAGISVGAVKKLALAGDRVVVEFTARGDVHLGAETTAGIKLTTILGSRYVELSPSGSGNLADNTIPLAATSVPYDLQKTLADATTTFEQVDADRAAESITTLSHSLDGVPQALPQALNNVKSLASVIAERRDQIGTLLTSVDTITALIHDEQASLGSLVVQGRQLLADIVTRRAALERLFASTTTLVSTIKRILDDAPGIDQMLESMHQFARMIAEHDALFRNTLQALPLPLRNFANASGTANTVDISSPALPLIDSWMCALSGRAEQFNLTEYFKDCA